MSNYRFFKQKDFDRCTPPCDISQMHVPTMEKFDRARQMAGIPFIVNSAFRSVAWEKSRGRNGLSAHCEGRAMDIRAVDGRQRYLIITALLKAGFTRIGVASTYVHADDDEDKPPEVIWTY